MIKPGRVAEIYTSSGPGEEMVSRQEIVTIKGRGIEGDRYGECIGSYSNSRIGARQISLITKEAFDLANIGREKPFTTKDSRRNIIIEGFPNEILNGLENKFLLVGKVFLDGDKYCEPCLRPSHLCNKPGFKEAFHNAAGFLFKVVVGGKIRVGDFIHLVDAH
jgi:MOSC domain-containing protein YiiM